jgi:mannose-6-phosphate isomerase-like protein (cupin superfamily)
MTNPLQERTVNLAEKFEAIHEHWKPRIVGELNGQHVKIAKLHGEFIWHSHEDADELFWIVRGELTLRFRDRDVILHPGEFFIVPRGVEHLPIALEEVHLVLIETVGTLNTGNVVSERTVEAIEV